MNLLQLLVPGVGMGGGTAVVAAVLPLAAFSTDYDYTATVAEDYPYTAGVSRDYPYTAGVSMDVAG